MIRIIRRVALTLVAATFVMAAWAAPAAAHGSVTLTLHGDGRGSVWLTAIWSDGDPITDPIGALLTATSTTGRTVGPVALRSTGDALTYNGTLAAGEWTVVAEMGTPAIARCQATMHVSPAASPTPTETRCAPPARAAPVPAPGSPGSSHIVGYGLAAVIAVAAAVGLFFHAKRSPAPARKASSGRPRKASSPSPRKASSPSPRKATTSGK